MFLRTTSKAFGHNKSELFGTRIHNSLCFGSHRASIADGNFSYMMEFSQSYTFTPVDMPVNGLRGLVVNWEQVVTAACKQYGISYLCYKFDGSGDSGDFEFNQMNTHDNLDLTFFDRGGMVDATNSSIDHFMRSRRWRVGGVRITGVIGFLDVLEESMSQNLASEHGGWEINAGGFGEVQYENESININFHEHYYECEKCGESYTDDNPCSCYCCPECSEPNTEMECEHCEIKFAKCDCGGLKNAAKAKCDYCVYREENPNPRVLTND
jgi:hypothetical protein